MNRHRDTHLLVKALFFFAVAALFAAALARMWGW